MDIAFGNNIRERIAHWADGAPPRGWAERLEAAALRGLSWAYGAASAANGLAYDAGLRASRRVACPVASVGNLSVGGTGKTPVVLLVARLLAEAGLRPAIVSRGYRRAGERRTVVVSDGRGRCLDDPAVAGDEPLMLARRLPGVPVVVGARRVEAADVAIAECGASAIVLDDGFQHRALARDCDLVLWDALRPLGAAAALPRGLLRERLGALRRGSAVVVTRCNLAEDPAAVERLVADLKFLAPELPLFRAGLALESVRPAGRDDGGAACLLTDEPIAAFCALGNPASFWRLLERTGARLVLRHAFPDHHSATLAELESLAEAARRVGARRLLMTEKDAVKLPTDWRPPLPAAVVTAAVTLSDDASRFRRFLLDRVASARQPFA